MNNFPLWAQIVIAILGSGTVGGIAGAISSSLAARQKIKELEFAYQQKLRENYFGNLKQYIDSIYIPISIATSNLSNEFNRYRRTKDLDRLKAEAEFRHQCENYAMQIETIYDQGLDAYLTVELSDELTFFCHFLRDTASCTDDQGVRIGGYIGRKKIPYTTFSSQEFANTFADAGTNIKNLIKLVTIGKAPLV